MEISPEILERQPYHALLREGGFEAVKSHGIGAYKVFDDSYFLWASPAKMQELVAAGSVHKFSPSPFPHGPFRREYEYLGDYPVHSPVFFDLRLKKNDLAVRYHLAGNLPAGLIFDRGLLTGQAQDATGIVHLRITAEAAGRVDSKNYMIRFFTGAANRMNTFTQGNYLRAGCGPRMVDYEYDQTYYRLIPDPLPLPTAPTEAARRAALWVKQEAGNLPILLFASGGIDSQCMVQAFLQAGVSFKCVFMRDVGRSNEMDDVYFRKFVAKYPAPFEIIDVNYRQFLESYRYVEMAHRYRFNNPEYGILLHLMDLYPDCYPVYAGRPIAASPLDDRSHILSLCGDENLSKARYLERNGRKGCIEFISSTPLLVASFLEMRALKDRAFGVPWLYKDKLDLLHEAGFDVSLAPPTKGTGFEPLMQQFPQDEYGNLLWTMHRGPLKSLYCNPARRNGITLRNGRLVDDGFQLIRPFPDGFSWDYILSNDVRNFH